MSKHDEMDVQSKYELVEHVIGRYDSNVNDLKTIQCICCEKY